MSQPDPIAVSIELGADHEAVVRVRGEIDLSSASMLRAVLVEQVVVHDVVTVDLSEVSFIDSSGLWALLDAHGIRRGALRLGPCSSQVQRALEITGLDAELARCC